MFCKRNSDFQCFPSTASFCFRLQKMIRLRNPYGLILIFKPHTNFFVYWAFFLVGLVVLTSKLQVSPCKRKIRTVGMAISSKLYIHRENQINYDRAEGQLGISMISQTPRTGLVRVHGMNMI